MGGKISSGARTKAIRALVMAAFSDRDACKILLVGDISKAFSDAEAIEGPCCQVYSNIGDAIEAAGKEDFRIIGVVMSDSSSKSGSALKRLREAGAGAKIVLLAQMHQEPAAIELAKHAFFNTLV